MASKSETIDLESLQKRDARRRRWLDSCLVLSVIVLFAALAALAVAGVLVVRDLQSRLQHERAHPEFKMSKVIGSAPVSTFMMQNFAHLEATSSKLQNHTMPWYNASLGSNYEFNPAQHSVQVKQKGSYFLYLELNVTCFGPCHSGFFRVQVSDKLRCDVHLSQPSSSQPQSQHKKCWTVTTLTENTPLVSQMYLPHGPLPHWKLELRGSNLGMFLVG